MAPVRFEGRPMSHKLNRTPAPVGRGADALFGGWTQGRLNRRAVLQRASALGLSMPALAGLARRTEPGSAAADVRRAAQEDPASGSRGGNLRVVTSGEPPTLDEHQATAGIIAEIAYCMYETLFTYDSQYRPIPMLAESHAISEDELTHTIVLRQGVQFHNG